jgi:hypothetical protein
LDEHWIHEDSSMWQETIVQPSISPIQSGWYLNQNEAFSNAVAVLRVILSEGLVSYVAT